MLEILPFLSWLAPITSAVLLGILWALGDLRRSSRAAFLLWFLVAALLQFFGGSPVASAAGLVLQTLLAITLIVRWRHGA